MSHHNNHNNGASNSQQNPFKFISDPPGQVPNRVKEQIDGSQNLMQVVFSTLELYVSNFANSIVAVIQSYTDGDEDKDKDNNDT